METQGGDSSRDSDAARSLTEVEAALDQLFEVAGQETDPEAVTRHLADAHAAAARILGRDERDRDAALQDRAAAALERLETRARSFFGEGGEAPERTARQLAALRFGSRLLRRIVRAASGLPRRDEAPFLVAELQDAARSLAGSEAVAAEEAEAEVRSESGAEAQAVAAELDETRLKVLANHVQTRLRAVRAVQSVAKDSVPRTYRMIRGLEAARVDLERMMEASLEGAAVPESILLLAEEVDTEKQRLSQLYYDYLDRASGAQRLAVLVEHSSLLVDALDDARNAAFEHAPSEQDLQQLARLLKESRRFQRALSRARAEYRAARELGQEAADLRARARRQERRVKRQIRRIRHLSDDRTLALRLQRLFSARLVGLWEALIFWLIMAVMGLIVVDHYREHPPGVMAWTDWTDTGICAVLLWDFCVRWLLSPHRGSFFLRHFLTEGLPSLPFGLLANLEHLEGTHVAVAKLVRLLRLFRVFRVLRILRPLLRLVRLMLFLARASDRLVERSAWILDRRIVFFADPVSEQDDPAVLERVRDLDGWIASTTSRLHTQLPLGARQIAARWRAGLVRAELEATGFAPAEHEVTRRPTPRDVHVQEVVGALRGLDESQVADRVGVDFAEQLTTSLRLFRLPFLRRVPLVRYVMGPTGTPDPLHMTARLANVLGDFLDWAHRAANWFADLHGTVTGTQFLDRLGMHLVQATARPAKRLIMFGVIVGLGMLLVRASNIEKLDTLADTLLRFLSKPLLVVGGLCLVPLLIGIWFRRIAGSLADFYDRVAEAQFLPLTETIKERHMAEQVHTLARRVLLPEARLAGLEGEADAGQICARLTGAANGPARSVPHHEETAGNAPAAGLDWGKCDFVMLFYREFQDGAPFHKNDTKVSNLLVGNLTLSNVRRKRLGYDQKRIKRLQRLHLGSGKGGVRGPCLWFNFITHSVAHHTARLLLDYNRHCIPSSEVDSAPAHERQNYEDWLVFREKLGEARRRGVVLQQEERLIEDRSHSEESLLYRTTEFNALHFLTADEERDAAVGRRFGIRVLRILKEDRKHLVRDIFGTFPMHELPAAKRTVNPYEFYRSYCSRGRMFLFPFVLGLFLLRGLRILVRRVFRIVLDVIHPDARPAEASAGHASFEVARRKIHRMRRPVVMEAVRLRAAFDSEYLGLTLPGLEPSIEEGDHLADDMGRLNASEHEWEEFRKLKTSREHRMRLLTRLVRQHCGDCVSLAGFLLREKPRLKEREGEAIRAIAAAVACDHRQIATIAASHYALVELFEHLPRGVEPRFRLRIPAFKRRTVARQVKRYWEEIAGEEADDRRLQVLFVDAVLGTDAEARRHLQTLTRCLPADRTPFQQCLEIMDEVADEPSSWTEQILAVRTVQTLGMLDLEGYESLIAALGDFEEVGDSPRAESLRNRRL